MPVKRAKRISTVDLFRNLKSLWSDAKRSDSDTEYMVKIILTLKNRDTTYAEISRELGTTKSKISSVINSVLKKEDCTFGKSYSLDGDDSVEVSISDNIPDSGPSIDTEAVQSGLKALENKAIAIIGENTTTDLYFCLNSGIRTYELFPVLAQKCNKDGNAFAELLAEYVFRVENALPLYKDQLERAQEALESNDKVLSLQDEVIKKQFTKITKNQVQIKDLQEELRKTRERLEMRSEIPAEWGQQVIDVISERILSDEETLKRFTDKTFQHVLAKSMILLEEIENDKEE